MTMWLLIVSTVQFDPDNEVVDREHCERYFLSTYRVYRLTSNEKFERDFPRRTDKSPVLHFRLVVLTDMASSQKTPPCRPRPNRSVSF